MEGNMVLRKKRGRNEKMQEGSVVGKFPQGLEMTKMQEKRTWRCGAIEGKLSFLFWREDLRIGQLLSDEGFFRSRSGCLMKMSELVSSLFSDLKFFFVFACLMGCASRKQPVI